MTQRNFLEFVPWKNVLEVVVWKYYQWRSNPTLRMCH